ncbi:hypothetical protein CPB84DRAFT_282792 [Gymnopilus junonius]|uniref:Uncharacterized protein n=1 Tax=Gymnopilus junonius TaxID=109634 RepID=A0A9P5NBD5_GYMJU|nr:hypothetical protein CPB84DRAFT_282792 [Gymnopilus junonius]
MHAAVLMRETPILQDIVDLMPSFIENFRDVKENRAALKALAQSCSTVVSALHQSYQHAQVKDQWVARNFLLISEFQGELMDVQTFLAETRKKRLPMRFVTSHSEKKRILEYQERLETALNKFKVRAHIGANEGLDQALRETHEIRELIFQMSHASSSSDETLSTTSTLDSSTETLDYVDGHSTQDGKGTVDATLPSFHVPSEEHPHSATTSNTSKRDEQRRNYAEKLKELERLKLKLESLEAQSVDKKQKHKQHRKKKPNMNTDMEPEYGPSAGTWNQFNYTWGTNPPPSPYARFDSDPGFSSFPFNHHFSYPGYPMPGYGHFSYAHGVPMPNSFASINVADPGNALVNVNSGNVSFSSVSNVGNDFSVRFGRRDSD